MAQNNEDKMKKEAASGTGTPTGKENTSGGSAAQTPEGRKVIRKVVQPKKKKIIIVTGNNDGGTGGGSQRSSGGYSSGRRGGYSSDQRGGASRSGNERRGGGSPGGSSSAPYRPIKPKTAPSQMSVDYHKPIPRSSDAPHTREAVREETAPNVTASLAANPTGAGAAASAVMPNAAAADMNAVQGPAEKTAAAGRAPGVQGAAAAGSLPKADAVSALSGAKAPVTGREQNGPAAADRGEARQEGSGSGSEYGMQSAQGGADRTAGRGGTGSDRYGSNRSERGSERNRGYGQGGQGNREGQGQGRSYGSGQGNRNGQGQGRSYGSGQGGRGYGQGGQGNREGQGQGRSYGSGQGGRGYGQGGQGNREGQGQGRSYGGGQSGRGYGQNAQGRSYGSGAQGGRGGSPAGGRGGSGGDFSQAGQNKRRSQGNAARDRHNRKDAAIEQNEQRERRNRSGRFIRPTVEQVQEPEEQIKVITIPEKLTIGALAEAMHLKPAELIKKLFLAGKAMTVNSEVTYEEAENIAADYEILCEKEEKVDVIQELLKEDDDAEETLVSRPPVICVMGHVDHGKTSILDYIRKTRVTEKEAGGITQAIGAYTVELQGRMITFLDTPGHEAFTAMRLRGAKSTDIAVLVIAADDGVMPQTIEAINHAKAAGVEIIVALNKIDKPEADPEKVRQQLTKYELVPTDWGGSTEFVNVSAKTGEGIDDLLETILLQADVMELRANPNRLARGLVLEAKLDRGRGPVANVLVQKGTLHIGDFISAGPAFGRVRAMINDKGQNVKEAKPSEPVVVLGLSDVPSAGEVLVGHPTNDEAKSYAQTYKAQHKEELVEENVMSMNVEDLFDQMREGKMKELGLIVKADVQGSVEALCASLLKLSNDEVKVRIIHSAAGAITESDVDLAAASNAAIIGFNVAPNSIAKSNAEHNGVSIHLYKVIYQAIDDVDAALKGMLAPVYEEKITGHAEVRQLFRSGKIGNIAGCMVLDGSVEKDASVRITRGGEKLFEGELASLKRFKDDVKEVKAGYDCGLVFRDYDSMQEGDQIECYKMVEVPREEVIARKEREAAKKERDAKQ